MKERENIAESGSEQTEVLIIEKIRGLFQKFDKKKVLMVIILKLLSLSIMMGALNAQSINSEIKGKLYDDQQNPVEDAKVFLLKLDTAGLDTVDIDETDSDGDFKFKDHEGEFFIYALTDTKKNFLPTYYPNTVYWHEAMPVTINAGDEISDRDIQFQVLEEQPEGIIDIFGSLNEGDDEKRIGPGDPLKGINVSLVSASDNKTVSRTLTNLNGEFKIEAVPAGNYRIYVDLPGAYMDTSENNLFEITDNDMNDIEVALTKYDDQIMVSRIGISSGVEIYQERQGYYIKEVFPNPASDHTYLFVKSAEDQTKEVVIDVYSMNGKKVISTGEKPVSKGDNFLKINLNGLTNGIYIVTVIEENGKLPDGEYKKKINVVR